MLGRATPLAPNGSTVKLKLTRSLPQTKTLIWHTKLAHCHSAYLVFTIIKLTMVYPSKPNFVAVGRSDICLNLLLYNFFCKGSEKKSWQLTKPYLLNENMGLGYLF